MKLFRRKKAPGRVGPFVVSHADRVLRATVGEAVVINIRNAGDYPIRDIVVDGGPQFTTAHLQLFTLPPGAATNVAMIARESGQGSATFTARGTAVLKD